MSTLLSVVLLLLPWCAFSRWICIHEETAIVVEHDPAGVQVVCEKRIL